MKVQKNIKRQIIGILKKNDVVKAGLFGSFARSEANKRSDIDILVTFKEGKSLLDLVGLKLDLEEKLGKKVDIVEYSAVHPLLKNKILKEQIRIL